MFILIIISGKTNPPITLLLCGDPRVERSLFRAMKQDFEALQSRLNEALKELDRSI